MIEKTLYVLGIFALVLCLAVCSGFAAIIKLQQGNSSNLSLSPGDVIVTPSGVKFIYQHYVPSTNGIRYLITPGNEGSTATSNQIVHLGDYTLHIINIYRNGTIIVYATPTSNHSTTTTSSGSLKGFEEMVFNPLGFLGSVAPNIPFDLLDMILNYYGFNNGANYAPVVDHTNIHVGNNNSNNNHSSSSSSTWSNEYEPFNVKLYNNEKIVFKEDGHVCGSFTYEEPAGQGKAEVKTTGSPGESFSGVAEVQNQTFTLCNGNVTMIISDIEQNLSVTEVLSTGHSSYVILKGQMLKGINYTIVNASSSSNENNNQNNNQGHNNANNNNNQGTNNNNQNQNHQNNENHNNNNNGSHNSMTNNNTTEPFPTDLHHIDVVLHAGQAIVFDNGCGILNVTKVINNTLYDVRIIENGETVLNSRESVGETFTLCDGNVTLYADNIENATNITFEGLITNGTTWKIISVEGNNTSATEATSDIVKPGQYKCFDSSTCVRVFSTSNGYVVSFNNGTGPGPAIMVNDTYPKVMYIKMISGNFPTGKFKVFIAKKTSDGVEIQEHVANLAFGDDTITVMEPSEQLIENGDVIDACNGNFSLPVGGALHAMIGGPWTGVYVPSSNEFYPSEKNNTTNLWPSGNLSIKGQTAYLYPVQEGETVTVVNNSNGEKLVITINNITYYYNPTTNKLELYVGAYIKPEC